MVEWSPRVLIVGWDGADWDLLKPLLATGRLPNLAALAGRGVTAALRSTLPPVTAPAWTSFATGMYPGHHGLVSWQLPLDAQFERPWADSRAAQRPRLWDWLGQAGLRTAVIGLPLTYPVQPLHGVMISGMLTPSLTSPFIHPPELAAEFRAALPDYHFDVDIQNIERDTTTPAGISAYLAELTTTLRQRSAAIAFAWERGPFDCAVIVFETPDRVQHLFYRYVTLADDGVTARNAHVIREQVLAVYTALDAALGELLARVDLTQTTVLMVSDHGFGLLTRDFHLGNWLAEQGFLSYAGTRVTLRAALARAIRPIKRWLPVGWLRGGRSAFASFRQVAWSRTVAYPGLGTEEGVWLNVRGREPAGTVAPGAEYERVRREIADRLLAWRDPADGAQIVTDAWPREEIYGEPFRGRAPDLVLRLADGVRVKAERGSGAVVVDKRQTGEGIHRPAGIFLAAGAGVRQVEETAYTPHLVDITPTTLALLGVPVPDTLDGAILQDVLRNSAAGRATQPGEAEPLPPATTDVYSNVESEIVRRRLAALGYMD